MSSQRVHVEACGLPGRCAYCHDGSVPPADRLACASCLAVHHRDCWRGACASCGRTTGLGARTTVDPARVASALLATAVVLATEVLALGAVLGGPLAGYLFLSAGVLALALPIAALLVHAVLRLDAIPRAARPHHPDRPRCATGLSKEDP